MSFGIVAAAAIGTTAVAGMYSAKKAAGAAKDANRTAGEMAASQLALDSETLDFYKSQYADQKPLQQEQARIANEVSTAQLASMKQNDTIAKDYYDYQTGTFRPMEKAIVADAQNYDTAERRNEKAGQAVADVGMQAELGRQANVRQMQRMGVNPNSGKMMAMNNQMALGEAVAKAGAANKARDAVETQGFARKMDAASLGRGLASNQATSAGVALNAGNSAVNNATTPINTIGGMTQTMGQGYNAASNGMASAHNLINTANNNQASMWGNAATGLMSSAGTMAGMYFGGKK
jgi:hypothetical protein